MESSRKRLGLIKGKLVKYSLYRAAVPKPSSTIQYGNSSSSSNRVPNQLERPSIIHHLNHHNNHDQHQHQPIKQKLVPYNPNSTIAPSFSSTAVDFILNQDQVSVPQNPRVSFYIPPAAENTIDRDFNSSSTTTNYNHGKTLDNESVDLKAASYISSVRERFKLERTNSERN
ncbi:hypothetical protein HAX54_024028 [Datura stramonium]|uniref:Uncharacterized protein n=1 Tax=Datura stramonium TaxID=4076 RepID=A0ABS8S592_DATST|nr:hypothetical protein [Datura stramonium]